MAELHYSGIEAEIAKFEKAGKTCEKACRKAVEAGGKLLAQRLSEAAPERTGALKKSIRAGKVEYSEGDGFHTKVAPNGESHGEPLAKIGNVLEYGRSNMEARPWFHPTVDRSRGEIMDEMRKAYQSVKE